jgi:peptide/nickel transport system substrate-binding protein
LRGVGPIVLTGVAITASACTGGSARTGGLTGSTPAQTSTTEAGRKGGTLNYATAPEPQGFNVNTATDDNSTTASVMDQVWPSVFHVTPDFNVVMDKDLMSSATVTSQNPQTVVMKIKPAATWSDGVPITADDFIYFWKQQRDPTHTTDSCTDPNCSTNGKPIDDSSDGSGYRNIQSITGADNGKTVTVVFSPSFGDWRSLWSHLVPAHLAQKVGWNKGFDNFEPNVVISGGPFKLQSYAKGSYLTLVPNDRYWGSRPNLDSIVFHFIPDPTQQLAALQGGQADMVYLEPQIDQLTTVRNMTDVNSELKFGLSVEQVTFNARTPGLDDVNVRKAIATAIDRASVVRQTVGQISDSAVVNNSRAFATAQPQYEDTSGGLYDRGDVVKAKQLLEQDGYHLGGDGVYAKAGHKLSFRVAAIAGDAVPVGAENLMQSELKAAGIDIKIDNPASDLLLATRLASHDFDLTVFAVPASPFPSVNNARYLLDGAKNYSGSGSTQLDELLASGAAELDAQKQAADYREADSVMWENMWTLPLFQLPNLLAVRNTFVNVHDNETAEGPFWNAQAWAMRVAGQ